MTENRLRTEILRADILKERLAESKDYADTMNAKLCEALRSRDEHVEQLRTCAKERSDAIRQQWTAESRKRSCIARVVDRIEGREEWAFVCFCDVCRKILPNVRTRERDEYAEQLAVEGDVTDLRPCPFCGETPTLSQELGGFATFRCRCGASGPLAKKGTECGEGWEGTRAREAWNRRAEDIRKLCPHGFTDCDECCWV